ncbi:uncharacterized protein LOC132209551 [Stegostoma tigrinum]|uniref:uncharacterized protein LOC132209551 n=1 Tax=Stegostoma tigrinum TaxID=3053191 RepID=UPI00287032A7|nr:uncharacterized protein LOC132209551 [Stegostoma tigrinum]
MSRGDEERGRKPLAAFGTVQFLGGTFFAQGEEGQAEEFRSQLQSSAVGCCGSEVGLETADEDIDESFPNIRGFYRLEMGNVSTKNLNSREDVVDSGSELVKSKDLFPHYVCLEHATHGEDLTANVRGEPRLKTKHSASTKQVTLPQDECKKQEEHTLQMPQNEIRRQTVDCSRNKTDAHLLGFRSIPVKLLEGVQTSFTPTAVTGRSETLEKETFSSRALANELKRCNPAAEEKASALPSGTLHVQRR